jgi:hypothetical protein
MVVASDTIGLDRLSVMPALVAGIHVFKREGIKDVDGRDEPGHDDAKSHPLMPTI